MTPVSRISWVLVSVLLLQGIAFADPPAKEDKSREDDLFGDEPAAPPAGLAPAQAATESDLGDARMTGPARENTELLSRDRTQIGGFFYTRNGATLGQGSETSDIGLSQTTLFDTYFDSRLNDRVRAYARARIIYNPLADVPASAGASALGFGVPGEEVRYVVDQLWLKFDLLHRVFVTVGRQHVRWGATRVWNPVDVINPTKYNPLLFFDDRTGVPMVKLHVPFNNEKWNAYLLVLNDNATTIDRLGAAARVETVFGQAEFGLSGKVQKGGDPKLGLDLSAGLGDIDLTAELGSVFPSSGDPTWLASAGLSYTYAYRDDDSLTMAVEYFHNPEGFTFDQVKAKYDAAAADYLFRSYLNPKAQLVLPALTPFYTGRDYAALVATVISPGNWSDTSITLLALSNLTDQSGLGRLSVSSLFLTDLTVEAFVTASWGDGELRGYVPMLKNKLSAALPEMPDADAQKREQLQQVRDGLHAPLLGAGLNLRVNL